MKGLASKEIVVVVLRRRGLASNAQKNDERLTLKTSVSSSSHDSNMTLTRIHLHQFLCFVRSFFIMPQN